MCDNQLSWVEHYVADFHGPKPGLNLIELPLTLASFSWQIWKEADSLIFLLHASLLSGCSQCLLSVLKIQKLHDNQSGRRGPHCVDSAYRMCTFDGWCGGESTPSTLGSQFSKKLHRSGPSVFSGRLTSLIWIVGHGLLDLGFTCLMSSPSPPVAQLVWEQLYLPQPLRLSSVSPILFACDVKSPLMPLLVKSSFSEYHCLRVSWH